MRGQVLGTPKIPKQNRNTQGERGEEEYTANDGRAAGARNGGFRNEEDEARQLGWKCDRRHATRRKVRRRVKENERAEEEGLRFFSAEL